MTCPDCGHRHAGLDLGQICVGCPCLSVPAGRPVRYHPARVQANADDYPDAAELESRRRWAVITAPECASCDGHGLVLVGGRYESCRDCS
jgi:hypothetical protein